MKNAALLIVLTLFASSLFAQKVEIIFKDGKKVKSEIKKIEAANYDGTEREEDNAIYVAQGQNEFRVPFKKIKSITFKSAGVISTFDDSRFAPVRKFSTQKFVYIVKMKKPGKGKGNIEIVDDRIFYFTLASGKEPIVSPLYKIKVDNGGKEGELGYKELQRMVKDMAAKSIKKIIFK